MATYYMRADGTAPNKETATNADSPSTSMNIATFNAETFANGDIILMSSSGGEFTGQINVSAPAVATLKGASDETVISRVENLYNVVISKAGWVVEDLVLYGDDTTFVKACIYAVNLTGEATFRNIITNQSYYALLSKLNTGASQVTLENCEFNDTRGSGINTQDTPLLIDGCTLNGTGQYSVLCSGGSSTKVKIVDSEINNSATQGVFSQGSADVEITDSTISGSAYDNLSANETSTMTINGCVSKLSGSSLSTSGDGATAHDTAELNCYNSIFSDNRKSGIAVTEGATGRIINNICYNNFDTENDIGWTDSQGVGIAIDSSGGWEVKNNICLNNGQEIVITSSATGTIDSNYNDLYPSRTPTTGTKPYHYKGAEYDTLAEYQTASSLEANSIDDDPLLADPANANFTIPFDSPTITANIAEIVTKAVSQPKAIAIKEALSSGGTLATRVKPIGSDELEVGQEFNLVSTNDNAQVPLSYGKDATGSFLASSDGTNQVKVYTTWNREDDIFVVSEPNEAGTQFRVGYCNFTNSETETTFGSLGTFAGSFPSGDYVTLAYDTTIPLYTKQAIIDNLAGDTVVLFGLSERYGE